MDNEEMKNRIRNTLISLRTERGLTQSEVGKIVDKSKNAVASWEQGLSLPDPITLKRLALYYQKTMDYMYGDED